MSKTIKLSPRLPDEFGVATWHDYYVLSNALASIARGKSFAQAALWMQIAAKITLAAAVVEFGRGKELAVADRVIIVKHMPEFETTLKNSEARLLWAELTKLKPTQFSATDAPPPLGTLWLMLGELAEQLGEKLPDSSDDDEDGDTDADAGGE